MTDSVRVDTPVVELTDEQLIERIEVLDKARDAAKLVFEHYKEAVVEAHKRKGASFHWQDSEGTVYQLATSEGRWVTFEPLVVNRTRRSDETKGSLSEKAAKELGYTLKGK